MISDYPLLDGSITTDRSGISFCFVAKALCRTCPCHYSHVSISEWSATRTKLEGRPHRSSIRKLAQTAFEERSDRNDLKRGYLTGAPGVDWKPPNNFRPSGMVTVPALATLRPSFAQ